MPKPRLSKDYAAFTKLTDRLLAVPRAELNQRLDAYKKQVAQQPNKRGPKPKLT